MTELSIPEKQTLVERMASFYGVEIQLLKPRERMSERKEYPFAYSFGTTSHINWLPSKIQIREKSWRDWEHPHVECLLGWFCFQIATMCCPMPPTQDTLVRESMRAYTLSYSGLGVDRWITWCPSLLMFTRREFKSSPARAISDWAKRQEWLVSTSVLPDELRAGLLTDPDCWREIQQEARVILSEQGYIPTERGLPALPRDIVERKLESYTNIRFAQLRAAAEGELRRAHERYLSGS